MKTTKTVKSVARKMGERALKSKVASRVLAVATTARDKALETRAGKRAAARAEGLVERVETLAGDSAPVKRVRAAVKSKLPSTKAAAKAPAPAPAKKKKKMPETIHTTSGGKRLPGNVAARAVRLGADDFKPKKGKK